MNQKSVFKSKSTSLQLKLMSNENESLQSNHLLYNNINLVEATIIFQHFIYIYAQAISLATTKLFYILLNVDNNINGF